MLAELSWSCRCTPRILFCIDVFDSDKVRFDLICGGLVPLLT
jgi:hypothetical protein